MHGPFLGESGRFTAKPDVILQRPSDQRHWVLLARSLLAAAGRWPRKLATL